MYTSYAIHTDNADLPISLPDAKAHMRYDDLSHDDKQIEAYIMAATRTVEQVYGMAILNKTIKEYWSKFPCAPTKPLLLRINPVRQVTSVQYLDESGTLQTWDTSEWTSGGYNGSTFIVPKPNYTWPVTWQVPNAITITYGAGFGAAPADVPWDIAQAIRIMVADMDLKREDSVQAMPRASENLLRPYYRHAV